MKRYQVITYSGIAAFTCLVIGFLLGIFQLDYHWHAIAGWGAFFFAIIHVGAVISRRAPKKPVSPKPVPQNHKETTP